MRVAITYLDGEIFEHFGHTPFFKLYDIDANGDIISGELISATAEGHKHMAHLLANAGVEVLICGGIGAGALFALEDEDIEVYAGVSGDADEAISMYVDGKLGHINHHHDHGEHCDCGCHEHHHDHDEHCDCGCHEHHHDHDEHCDCGCHHH